MQEMSSLHSRYRRRRRYLYLRVDGRILPALRYQLSMAEQRYAVLRRHLKGDEVKAKCESVAQASSDLGEAIDTILDDPLTEMGLHGGCAGGRLLINHQDFLNHQNELHMQ